MDFHKNTEMPKSFLRMLDLNVYFEIYPISGGYSFHPLGNDEFDKYVRSVLNFSRAFHEQLEIQDLLHASSQELKVVLGFHQFLKKFIQIYGKKKNTLEHAEVIERIKKHELAIALGGKIPINEIDEEELRFLLVNDFHKRSLPFRMQLRCSWDEGILIPCEIDPMLYHNIPMKKMEKTEVFAKNNKLIGYKFFFGDYFLFQTDAHLKLIDKFTLLCDGISRYHREKSFVLYRTFKSDPSQYEKKNQVEILFHGKKLKSLSVILKREDGSVYSIGSRKGKIISPSLNFTEPATKVVMIKCTKNQINLIKKKIEDERFFPARKAPQENLFVILADVLQEDFVAKKPIAFSNKWLAYLTLPIGIVYYCVQKKNCKLETLLEFLKKPYGQYCIDEQSIRKQLIERS